MCVMYRRLSPPSQGGDATNDAEGVEAEEARVKMMPPEGRQLYRGIEGVGYVRAGGGGGGGMAYVLVWVRRRLDVLFSLCCRQLGEKVVYSSPPRVMSRVKKKLFDVPFSEYEEAQMQRRRSLLSCRPTLVVTTFVIGFVLYVVCVIGTAAIRAMWAVTSEMGEDEFSGGHESSPMGSTPSTVEMAPAPPPTLPVLSFIFSSDPVYALVMLFRSLVSSMSMNGYKHCQVRSKSQSIP